VTDSLEWNVRRPVAQSAVSCHEQSRDTAINQLTHGDAVFTLHIISI
jgi:hypothetical protein